MLSLREITPENHIEVRALEVHSHQKGFVATIDKSLADAFVWQGAAARAGYNDNLPVGFVLIYPFKKDDRRIVNIVRFLIGAEFQGQGLGKELLSVTLKWIDTLSADLVRISTVPQNQVALSLYKKVGFIETGIEDGEVVLEMIRSRDD